MRGGPKQEHCSWPGRSGQPCSADGSCRATEALLGRLSRTEYIQLKMADTTGLRTRGSAYTQLMWVVMQSYSEGRWEVLAVHHTPDEFRSV